MDTEPYFKKNARKIMEMMRPVVGYFGGTAIIVLNAS